MLLHLYGTTAVLIHHVWELEHNTVDPRLLPVGNPFKYHVPGSGFVCIAFVMYITTTMCDGVLHCLWFVFNVFLVSLHGE